METLVVLTTLVCAVIAAPTLQELRFQDFKPTQDILQDLPLREKKSPAGTNGFMEFSNTETSSSHSFDSDSFPESARSLHFKKPLIVKKKVGYHLYRDSDEEKEQATSRESCKERIKVKLCDENTLPKTSDLTRTTTIEDIGDHVMTEDEMKHSLKMAKQAIANLERDLEKIEQKPGTKISQRQHDDVDAQIHEDIDTARHVLEHIHKNFGDLESMSIHTTTSKDADSLHNVHLTIAKTEEERMAQWKEAMKNIQKNTEIARNIEDSFKSTGHDQTSNDSHMVQTSIMDGKKALDEMRTENTELIDKKLDKDKQCDSKLHDPKLAQNQAEDPDNDMNGFASTITGSNVDVSGKLLRNDNPGTTFDEKTTKAMFGPLNKNDNRLQQSRSPDTISNGHAQIDGTDSPQDQISSMRETESIFDQDNTEAITTNGEALNVNPIASTSNMKEATEPNVMKNAADCMDNAEQVKFNQNRNTEKSGGMKALTKSATNSDTSEGINTNINDKFENNFQIEQRKNEDSTSTITSKQLLHQTKNTENDAMTGETEHIEHAIVKPFDNTEANHFQGKMDQHEQMKSKSELSNQDQEKFATNLKPIHTEVNTGMKTAHNEDIPTQPSTHAFNMRWPSDQVKNNKHTILDKGSADIHSDLHNRAPSLNTHFMNGPQMMPSMNSESIFDASSTHAHMHTSHGNRMHGLQGKTPDNIAQSNFNMNMRDAMGNFGPENNVMRWKPTHESGRTAYGPPATVSGAGPSAVGLFPNANVGGCSIPLLLSCSPSVTSGSLAKALPAGYASPAYRTEDEFTFFPNKREIKKNKDVLDTTVSKMSTNTKLKTTMDNKQ